MNTKIFAFDENKNKVDISKIQYFLRFNTAVDKIWTGKLPDKNYFISSVELFNEGAHDSLVETMHYGAEQYDIYINNPKNPKEPAELIVSRKQLTAYQTNECLYIYLEKRRNIYFT